jgi:hypothetical protein
MSRKPHHSKNWGGARPNSGPKKGSVRKLAQQAIDIVALSDQHPLEYIMEVMNDEDNPVKLRLEAAQSAAPYCMSRLTSTEINITRDTDGLTEEQLLQRYLATQAELIGLIPQGKLINGTALRIEPESVHSDGEVVQ